MKMIEWIKGQKPAIKYTIIIAPIVVIIILIIVIIAVATYPSGKGLGAYLKVPDSSNLQYRLGNDAGLYSNGWDDSKSAILGSWLDMMVGEKNYLKIIWRLGDMELKLMIAKQTKE